ncbi:MAG: hypothetical protein ABSE51_10950, partial [Terracidiphilus sp.]
MTGSCATMIATNSKRRNYHARTAVIDSANKYYHLSFLVSSKEVWNAKMPVSYLPMRNMNVAVKS